MQTSRVGGTATAKVSLFLLTTLLSVFLSAYSVQQVWLEAATWTVDDDAPADFPTIQAAINAAQPGDSIIVKSGIYSEHVMVNKSVTLTGENASTTIVDGGGSGTIILVTVNNVTVEKLRVQNGRSGIVVAGAQNCTIRRNLVEGNRDRGILITASGNCTVSDNYALMSASGYGINVNASQNVLIVDNGASGNYYDGIGVLSSSNSVVRGNTVNNNTLYGMWVQYSSGNHFYHNNVFDNGKQSVDNTLLNSWDNGTRGNYWSDYAGSDADANGVGDEPYIVDELTQRQDRFPLFRPYINEVYLIVDTEPPVVSFTFSPEKPLVNDTVSFDASESTDSVGKNAIVGYNWDFGDGATAAGMQVDHTYSVPGNHTVVLSVVDVAGNEGHASVQVSVGLEESGEGQLLLTVLTGILLVSGGVGLFFLLRRRKSRQPER